jgi:SAM-dependent methyltransferase
MSAQETFEIPLAAAEAYEEHFVPSIFAEWAPHCLDGAGVGAGDRVLDVACGTGIVARTAADRVGPTGAVTGVDRQESMLTVARRVRPDLDWQAGDALALPFDDDVFDAVTCQMALMFVPDVRRAFAEMARVARPDGRVGVVVPASLDVQPAYGPFVEIAVRHAGEEARSLLDTYWCRGDLAALAEVASRAGLTVTERRTRTGTARFASSDAFVATEIDGSPLAERIDDATRAAISSDVGDALARYRTGDGFDIPLVGHVLGARTA